MSQPLVTRPAYGHGGSAMPTANGSPVHLGESGLPTGGPAKKGQPLDSDIPGTATHAKPVQDIREQGKDDEDFRRVDGPDDLAKDRSRIDTREDNANKHDGIGQMGKGEWDTTVKTKYPYRDGRPHEHYASVTPADVLDLWSLRQAHEVVLHPEQIVKVAAKLSEIVKGLSKSTRQKAAACKVAVKRTNKTKLGWTFTVNCGNGPKLVSLEADRRPRVTRITGLDLRVRCNCPAWEYLGPEHHAQQHGYLKGTARGTASTPAIRDQKKQNRVCKHVAAVLRDIKDWTIPKEDED